jgi:hypothetical protein
MKKLALLSVIAVATLCAIAAEPNKKPDSAPQRPIAAERMRKACNGKSPDACKPQREKMFALIKICKNDPSDANIAALQKFFRAEKMKQKAMREKIRKSRAQMNACKCNCKCNMREQVKPAVKKAKKDCAKAACKDAKKNCRKAPCKNARKCMKPAK